MSRKRKQTMEDYKYGAMFGTNMYWDQNDHTPMAYDRKTHMWMSKVDYDKLMDRREKARHKRA